MKCPTCSYPNPQGVTYCQMCYEVFNKSAADRYLHAQKRARLAREGPPPDDPSDPLNAAPSGARILSESRVKIDWGELFSRALHTLRHVLQTYTKELGLAAVIIVVGVLALVFTSPEKRLLLFGKRLAYDFPPNSTVPYLVTVHFELKSWSERAGRLDTPLSTFQKDEMGTLQVDVSSVKLKLSRSSPKKKVNRLYIHPKEWIVTQTGGLSQNIPFSHPSLKSSQAFLDRRGVLVRRDATSSTRLGRAAVLLLPRWPGSLLRTGHEWAEPIEWVQSVGDWKILWKGKLQWKVVGMETRENAPCIHLTYKTNVKPSLWESPFWAKKMTRGVSFTGSGVGEAYFDTRTRRLMANDFTQEGALTLPIDNIYRIPPELRVGRTPRRRYGQPAAVEPGTIVIQIKDRLAVLKS